MSRPIQLGLLALVFAATALLSNMVLRQHLQIATIWLPCGILLSVMLLSIRKRWPGFLAVYLVVLCITSYVDHTPWPLIPVYVGCDLLEVTLAAVLLRRGAFFPKFTDVRYLTRYIAYAIVIGPCLSGLIAAAATHMVVQQTNLLSDFWTWTLGDMLGMAIGPPVYIGIWRERGKHNLSRKKTILLFAIEAAAGLAIILFPQLPLLVYLFPVLILIGVQLGLGISMAVLFTLFIVGCVLSVFSRGLLSHSWVPEPLRMVVFQGFILAGIVLFYALSIILARLRRDTRMLQHNSDLYHLIANESRDIIVITDIQGVRRYISPAIRQTLGWNPEEILGAPLDVLVHPEDMPNFRATVEQLVSLHSDGKAVQYRARTASGNYLWVEGNLRLYRRTPDGPPVGFLNIVRDISENKRAEQELRAAYRVVEALAIVDGLTGIPNRRRFDEVLTSEWRRSAREGIPLSLILLDVDHFKLYNDQYGHVRGDSALKQVSEAALDIVSRPADLVARYGGEEFAILLPNTNEAGAFRVAEQVRLALIHRKLSHEGNKPYGILSASFGHATMVPQRGMSANQLVEAADRALYRAKNMGRNCVCSNNPDCEPMVASLE